MSSTELPAARDAYELDRLWRTANTHEARGDVASAETTLDVLFERLTAAGAPIPAGLSERLHRVRTRMGDHLRAAEAADLGRANATHAGDRAGVVHFAHLFAQTALTIGDRESARDALATAYSPQSPAAEPPRTLEGVRAALTATSDGSRTVLHFEAGLTVGRYWASHGQFGVARAMVGSALEASSSPEDRRTIAIYYRREDAVLLQAEWALDAGLGLDQPAEWPTDEATRRRWQLLRARDLRLRGQLTNAEQAALSALPRADEPLERVHVQAALSAAHTRMLLNRLHDAEAVLDSIERRFAGAHGAAAMRADVREARQLIIQRRSQRAREIALMVAEGAPTDGADVLPTLSEGQFVRPHDASERFVDRWSAIANRVLAALTRHELDEAHRECKTLEELARTTDSSLVTARTEQHAALVDYACGRYDGAEHQAMAALARARKGGWLLDQWNAARVLAWIATRRSYAPSAQRVSEETPPHDVPATVEHHAERAGAALEALAPMMATHDRDAPERAQAILNSIAEGLAPEDRPFFLLNKWSAQDMAIAARMRELDRLRVPRWPWASLRAIAPRWPWPRIRAHLPRWPLGWLRAAAFARTRRLERLRAYRWLVALSTWDPNGRSRVSPSHALSHELDPLNAPQDIEAFLELQNAAGLRRVNGALDVMGPLLAQIPANVALIHFHIVPEAIFVFVLQRNRIDHRTVRGNRVDMNELTRSIVSAGSGSTRDFRPNPVAANTKSLGASLADFARAIDLPKVLEYVGESVEHLSIIPHGALTHVPFGAMPMVASTPSSSRGSDGAALCDRYVVSVIPRLQLFDTERSVRRHRAAEAHSLIVGVSRFPGTDLKPLTFVPPECEAVADAMGVPRAEIRWNDEARVATVRNALERVRVAHIATHGYFNAAQPHESGLVLAPDGAGPLPAKAAGETVPSSHLLTVSAIRRLRLDDLELLVLSSCRSSSSAVLPGQELVGLAAAFLDAGVHEIVASLWDVGDSDSREFMVDFYEHLKNAPPARALAATQAKWRRAGKALASWAGYVHMGNGARRRRTDRPSSPTQRA